MEAADMVVVNKADGQEYTHTEYLKCNTLYHDVHTMLYTAYVHTCARTYKFVYIRIPEKNIS